VRLVRFAWLLAGLVALCVMALLAFTPIVWIHSGRESETYPELIYFGLGLPAALVATLAGAVDAKFSSSRPTMALIPLRATGLSAVLVCAWLVWIGLEPKNPSFDVFAGASFDGLSSFGLPILIVALLVSARVAARPPRPSADAGSV